MTDAKIRNLQIVDEAADWAVVLDAGGLSAAQNRQLADWLLESPCHVKELLLAVSLLNAFEGVDVDKSRSIDTLLADTSSEVVSIVRHSQQNRGQKTWANENPPPVDTGKPKRQWVRWFGTGVVASIAIILLSIAIVPQFMNQSADKTRVANLNETISGFATQLGEQRKITLEDGSIIHVNTQSEVAISYEETQRVIELVRGEALFEVAHDPSRPFRVIAGDTIAEAVGTTFNVYRTSEQTTVAVIDGKVAVLTQRDYVETPLKSDDNLRRVERTDDGRLLLAAGQKANVAPETKTVQIATVNVKAISSWSVGQLIFKGDTLAHIAEQFNRYNRTRIVINDDALAGTEFSGVFDSDDPDSLIAFLELTGGIKVDRSDANFIKLSTQ